MISHYGSTPMPPMTGGRPLSPRSFPHTGSACLAARFPRGTDSLDRYGLTALHVRNIRKARDLSVCRRDLLSAWSYSRKDPPTRLPFGPSLEQQLVACSTSRHLRKFAMLSLLLLTLAPHRLLLAASTSPRGLVYHFRRVRFRPLHTPGLLPTHGTVGSTG